MQNERQNWRKLHEKLEVRNIRRLLLEISDRKDPFKPTEYYGAYDNKQAKYQFDDGHLWEVIYKLSNCIVHNKESELHFTYANTDVYADGIDLMKKIVEKMEPEIVKVINDPAITDFQSVQLAGLNSLKISWKAILKINFPQTYPKQLKSVGKYMVISSLKTFSAGVKILESVNLHWLT